MLSCGINEHSKVQSDIRISSVKSDVHITQIRIENESIVNLYAKKATVNQRITHNKKAEVI